MSAPEATGSGAPAGEEPSKITRMVSEIGKKLQKRQDRDELVQRNILKEQTGLSPALVQTKMELEKSKFQDKLSGKIQRRPSREELQGRNILKPEDSDDEGASDEDGTASSDGSSDAVNFDYMPTPAIEMKPRSFADRQRVLKSCLKLRPDKESLEDRNILKPSDKMDPSLSAASEKLKRAQLENVLEGKIRNRPNPEDVSHFLNFNEVVEVLPTFRATDYNRKTDDSFTFKRLTPKLKQEIREELNHFKREEMEVHKESSQNTAFH